MNAMPAKRHKAEPVRPRFLDLWERKIQKVLSASSSAPKVPWGSLLYSYPLLHAPLRKLGTLDELLERAGLEANSAVSLFGSLPSDVMGSNHKYVKRTYSLLFGPETDQQAQLFDLTGKIQRELLKHDVSKRVEYLNQGRQRKVSRMTDVDKVQVIIERLYLISYRVGGLVEEHRTVRIGLNGKWRKRILTEQRIRLSLVNSALNDGMAPRELRPGLEQWRANTTDFFRGLRQSMSPFLKRRETTAMLDAGIAIMKELGPFYGRKSKANAASLLLHAFHPDLWSSDYESLKSAYLSKSRKPLLVI